MAVVVYLFIYLRLIIVHHMYVSTHLIMDYYLIVFEIIMLFITIVSIIDTLFEIPEWDYNKII